MIELPESHILAQQISETLKGKRIRQVTANHSPHKFAWFSGDPENYSTLLSGKTIRFAQPFGGMVEIQADDIRLIFADGTNPRYFSADQDLPKKHQLHIEFDDDSSLVCTVQMYGALWALSEGQTEKYNECARNKVSPLSDKFDEKYFQSLYTEEDSKLSIKAFLATNQRIPGLGNGVLQDILFHAGLHPKRKMNSLSDKEFSALYQSVKDTLFEMTIKGGRDTEKDFFGCCGGYHTILSSQTVDTPCPICGSEIHREAYLGGRIYFCPLCQPLKK